MSVSLWTFSRWAIVAHHTCHGGYNSLDQRRWFHSHTFAVKSSFRRVRQWLDWMLPEAWCLEHNQLHHYRLGEEGDPDLVQRNLQFMRDLRVPKGVKYLGVLFLMMTWKWFYYAPNTYKELTISNMRKRGEPVTAEMEPRKEFTLKYFIEPKWSRGPQHKWFGFRHYMRRVMGPYLVGRFVLLPLPFLLLPPLAQAALAAVAPVTPPPVAMVGGWGLGLRLFRHALVNVVLAEVATNVHSFVMIMPNHCGSDLYHFGDRSCVPNSGTFYLRQVVSSANFRTGGDVNDFLHGWLNYGIEHHLMPQLSALSYRRSQPQVQALCAKHGIPYVQESVWERLKKTVAVMTGDESMREFPEAWDVPEDRFCWAGDSEATSSKKS